MATFDKHPDRAAAQVSLMEPGGQYHFTVRVVPGVPSKTKRKKSERSAFEGLVREERIETVRGGHDLPAFLTNYADRMNSILQRRPSKD